MGVSRRIVGSMVSSRQLVWLTVSSLRYVLRGGGRGQKFDYRWQGWGHIRVIISHKGRQGQVFGVFIYLFFFFLLSIVTAERSAVVASAALVEASASPKGSR